MKLINWLCKKMGISYVIYFRGKVRGMGDEYSFTEMKFYLQNVLMQICYDKLSGGATGTGKVLRQVESNIRGTKKFKGGTLKSKLSASGTRGGGKKTSRRTRA